MDFSRNKFVTNYYLISFKRLRIGITLEIKLTYGTGKSVRNGQKLDITQLNVTIKMGKYDLNTRNLSATSDHNPLNNTFANLVFKLLISNAPKN